MRHIFFFFFFAMVLKLLAGCVPGYYAPPTYAGNNWGAPAGPSMNPAMASVFTPVPASNVGFVARPPLGWSAQNPRSVMLSNGDSFMRCWIDGREVVPTVAGSLQPMPVANAAGQVELVPITPPKTPLYEIVSVGRHHVECRRYVGPAPLQEVGNPEIWDFNTGFQAHVHYI
jgi:hypothetical protein